MELSFFTLMLGPSISGVDYPWVNIGIAEEHLVLAATELGLGTCWIGWIRPRVLARIVGWPASVRPMVVITVGYASDGESAQPPALRRRPLAELVRWLRGGWGCSAGGSSRRGLSGQLHKRAHGWAATG